MNDTTNTHLQLLAQADLLLLVNRLLQRPDQQVVDQWDMPDQARQALIHTSGLPEPAPILEALSRIAQAVAGTDRTAWLDEHARLFEASVACPPNESAYIRRDKGAILSDICGFYQAFGFVIDPKLGEKADHLVAEIQFLAMLAVMTANAHLQDQAEQAQVARDALTSFARDHLGDWILSFCDRLEQTSGLAVYQHTARYLATLWRSLAAYHNLPVHHALPILEPLPDDGTPYECDMAAGCGFSHGT